MSVRVHLKNAKRSTPNAQPELALTLALAVGRSLEIVRSPQEVRAFYLSLAAQIAITAATCRGAKPENRMQSRFRVHAQQTQVATVIPYYYVAAQVS
jgi:hypothetical protein